jgi:3-oxoacyl-[acyl-carrier protein] reductase
MTRLADKVALVTGAARGIGAATARRLAADGADVAVIDQREQDTGEMVAAIREAGGSAVGIGCDVADAGQVEAAFARTVNELGRLDILVNNAGVIRDNLLFKMTEDDWDTVMSVHLRGAFLCSREAQKHMVAQKSGKIVNLSSTSALGNRGQANYSAAKAGIQGFTRTLAIELGPFGINVNAVAPGFIATAMTDATARRVGVEPEQFREAAAAAVPLGRIGLPEDIANVVAFLVSEDASYVTGQTIYVDGGPH